MDRRNFLDVGFFVSMSSLASSGVIGGALAYIGLSGHRAALNSNELFRQLLTFESFREIDKILVSLKRPYLLDSSSLATVVAENVSSSFSVERLNLAKINLSHGRLSNFSSRSIDPLSAYVITQGDAGRRLREQTEMKVISRYSPVLSNKPYFADAFPHHFNSYAVGGPEWFREYWIDSRTRAPIGISLQVSRGIPESKRSVIEDYASELRLQLAGVEKRALEKLGEKYAIKSFDPLIANSIKKVSLVKA